LGIECRYIGEESTHKTTFPPKCPSIYYIAAMCRQRLYGTTGSNVSKMIIIGEMTASEFFRMADFRRRIS
jgi:hypothetical protein